MDDDLARQRLASERERLAGVRAAFDDEHLGDQTENDSVSELSAYDQHQADLGTETFEREKDLSILEQVEAELADVEHALRRLDEGTYGTCEVCGRAIPDERLEAVPAARLCLEHRAEAEREVRVAGDRAGVEHRAADGDGRPMAAGGAAVAERDRRSGQASGYE